MTQTSGRYDDIDPTIEARVDALLTQMTLPEKVGQLVQMSPHAAFDVAALLAQKKAAEEAGLPFVFRPALRDDLDELVRSGRVGSFLNIMDPQLNNHLQKVAREQSRLGIPLIMGADVIHGLRTVFPIPLAESCTWDPALLEKASRAAAEEASAVGIDWIFAPMVDIGRDPRWGRVAEGGGEDPFLGSALAVARVRGFQADGLASGRRIVACPKHYVGYGASEAGRDYNTVDFSERTLRDVHLPPFKAALTAGAGSVMSSFNEIAGIPATANSHTLRTILRDEWQWAGVVLSDYNAVQELIPHGIAADLKDAARLSILAGLDIDMCSNAYDQHLAALVEEGAVPVELVDEAVRRVLRLKLRLGLFEKPYVAEGLAAEITLNEEFRALALQVAQSSLVLLKNEHDILPLNPQEKRLAVIGPLADNQPDLLGTWSISGRSEDVETVLAGIQRYVVDGLAYELGCSISEADMSGIPAAVAAAAAADAVVLVLGESADMSGEAHSRSQLGLPGVQDELVAAVAAVGKPLICVLMSGRPLVIPHLVEQVDALIVAWHGGIRAGRAVADVLFGVVNPSGKLSLSWPRTVGQIPVYYSHKNTGRPAAEAGVRQFAEAFKSVYMDIPNSPLFPFGHGLSYTTFTYDNLQIERPRLGLNDTLVVTVTVTNSGVYEGAEVVQLYIRDLVASVTRPVKELKGFQKLFLPAGASQTVRFEVPVCELGFTGREMRYVVEPGTFKLWVGPDATQGLEEDFTVLPR